MQILIGDRVKGAEAIALRRLRRAVKDLVGLLLVNFYLGRRQFDFPFEDRIIRRRDIVGELPEPRRGAD